jgi:hypothetical protein
MDREDYKKIRQSLQNEKIVFLAKNLQKENIVKKIVKYNRKLFGNFTKNLISTKNGTIFLNCSPTLALIKTKLMTLKILR